MIARLGMRMLRETSPRVLSRLVYTCGWKGSRALARHKKRLREGRWFPPFVFVSVTNACNLSCQGCWITPSDPPVELDVDTLDRIVSEAREQGCCFFGLLGGEPLMYDGLFDVVERYRDCYFLLFTNGTLLNDETAARMARCANVSPLISIEGGERVSDIRRGGRDVYGRSMRAVECSRKHRLMTGVATSVCRSNIEELATESFLEELVARGVHYVWYYIYRPVGERPAPELALSEEQILSLRRFTVDMRLRYPLMIVDSYWDHEGHAICPAAAGVACHISPAGAVEPCPPIQFACDNVGDGSGLAATLDRSEFLAGFRQRAAETTQGCILLERPDVLGAFVAEQGAMDSSGRDACAVELAGMQPQPGHHLPGREIPERHWMYRVAKRNWFFGLGAYG